MARGQGNEARDLPKVGRGHASNTPFNPDNLPVVPDGPALGELATEDGECAEPSIEQTVLEDLARIGKLGVGVRNTLAQVAIRLARTLDAQPLDAPPEKVARLAQELRTTLLAVMGVNQGSDSSLVRELFGLLQAPIRDEEDVRS